MKVEQLRALVAVSRAGSFRRAAAEADSSQATLSRTLAALEADLGIELLSRTPQGVVLTPAGKRILDRAEAVLADVERLAAEARHLRGEAPGDLRLALSPYAALALLPPALRRFRRAFPTGTVEVDDAFYPDILPALRDGLCDLAVVAQPHGAADSGIIALPLMDLAVVVAAGRDNPLAGARSIAAIAGAPWVAHGPAAGPAGLFELPLSGLPAPRCLTRSHALLTLIAVMRNGHAFSFLSDRLLAAVGPPFGLTRVPVADPLPRYSLALLVRQETVRSPTAQLMMDAILHAAQHAPPSPPTPCA